MPCFTLFNLSFRRTKLVVILKRFLIVILSIALLSGCEQIFAVKNYVKSFFHEEVVFFYTSTDYPKKLTETKIKNLRQRTLIFGLYMPNIGSGGGGVVIITPTKAQWKAKKLWLSGGCHLNKRPYTTTFVANPTKALLERLEGVAELIM